jgi:acyl carrier protein
MNEKIAANPVLQIAKVDFGGMFQTYEMLLKVFNEAVANLWCGNDEFEPAGYHTRFTSLIKNGRLDAFDIVEIVIALEDEFSIDIPETVFDESVTVSDFIERVAKITGDLAPQPVAAPVPVAVPVNDTSHDNDYGILVIPSLEEHGRLIISQPVSIAEAKILVNEFNDRVFNSRKIKDGNPDSDDLADDNIEFFHNVIRFDQLNQGTDFDAMDAELEALNNCQVPKTRGFRATFISPTTIGIGTTVIYNKNWATVNFSDPTMYDQLKNIADAHK